MKRFLSLPAIATVLAVAVVASAQPVASPAPDRTRPETVTVNGTGHSSVEPDRFTFSVGVQTVANTVDDAVRENNRRVASVLAALKSAGAEEKDIQTSRFTIWPQQDYSREGKLPRIIGYQVSNNVSVRSKKVAEAGKLLGVAVQAGVNTSSGINFEVSDPARGRAEGLGAAFEDAHAKAAVLAQAAGRSLGRAMIINEGAQSAPPTPYPVRAMAMQATASTEVPIEAGTQEQTYTISVTFELR